MRRRKNDKHSVASIDNRARKFLPEQKQDSSAERCFVVDGMNLAYTAYYAYSHLRTKGKSTSIIFGMPMILKGILMMYKAAKVIICWDGNKHPERMKLLPEYKSHREKHKDRKDEKKRKDFFRQINKVQKMFYYLGVPQVYNPQMEGDDAIYWVTKKMQNIYKVWIISGDKDFCQLINYDVQIYNPRSKTSISTFAFIVDIGVEITQFVDYLCLVGDSSDDIPGYRGIGPARACKFLNQFGSIRNYLRDKKSQFSGISDKKGLKKLWKRNRQLIDLKRFNEKYHTEKDVLYIKNRKMPILQKDRFTQFCTKFGLKTMLTENFQKPFLKLQENV